MSRGGSRAVPVRALATCLVVFSTLPLDHDGGRSNTNEWNLRGQGTLCKTRWWPGPRSKAILANGNPWVRIHRKCPHLRDWCYFHHPAVRGASTWWSVSEWQASHLCVSLSSWVSIKDRQLTIDAPSWNKQFELISIDKRVVTHWIFESLMHFKAMRVTLREMDWMKIDWNESSSLLFTLIKTDKDIA